MLFFPFQLELLDLFLASMAKEKEKHDEKQDEKQDENQAAKNNKPEMDVNSEKPMVSTSGDFSSLAPPTLSLSPTDFMETTNNYLL